MSLLHRALVRVFRSVMNPIGKLIDTPIRKQRIDHPDNHHHRRYYGLDEWLDLLQQRFEIEVFDALPEAGFLRGCQLPSQGSIAVCRKPG